MSTSDDVEIERRSPVLARTTRPILVLGMHRSGTSATARVLGLMGARIGEPGELLPAHATDNPTGYWERAELNAIHDRLLASTGHAWDRVAGFDPQALDAEACMDFSHQLHRLVEKLDAGGKPWLVKDPRLCLLLSQWRPLLKPSAAYVVVVRDPREIAASMWSGPRGTFTSAYVVALWEKYLRTVLAELSGERVLFISYASLLTHPQAQTARLLRGLRKLGVGGLHAPSPKSLATFLDVRLRRSSASSHVELSPTQGSLNRWLDAQCQVGGAVTVLDFPTGPAPDAVLAECQAAFAWHIEHGRAQAGSAANERLGQIESLLADNVTSLAAKLADAERQRDEYLAAQTAQAEQARVVAESLATRLGEAERQRDEYLAAQAAQAKEARVVAESLATRLGEAERQRDQYLAAQTSQAEGANVVAESLATRLGEAERQRDQYLAAQTVQAKEAQAFAGRLEARLADSERQLEEHRRALAQKAIDIQHIAARLEDGHAATASLTAKLVDAERQRDEHQRARLQQAIEVEHMQAQLAAQKVQTEEARVDAERQRAEQQQEITRQATEVYLRDLEMARLSAHAAALHDGTRALHASWSWKITAPIRGVGSFFRARTSVGMEQRLYRWYYAIPGLSSSRKRALILWLHTHASGLTGHTLSYQLYARSHGGALSNATIDGAATRMDASRARLILADMPVLPRISIVMPVFNVERRWLLAAVDSVRNQFYPQWELCIVDDASTLSETKKALDDLSRSDPRIKIKRLRKNVGIAGASNAALKLASGDYVGLLDNDDALTRDALLTMAQKILAHDPDILYSDEDKLDIDGCHVDAHFKSDFNLDYFLSINYICHFTVIRRALLERIGGFRAGYEGAQDYDLLLRATEHGEHVHHVPQVLYHWRMIPGSTAATSSAKPKSWDAGQRALSESLARRRIDATAELGPYPNTFRVRRAISRQPLVSILLPFRDMPELLSTCVLSILEKTDYPQYEILGIDNGSVDPATHALMRELERRDARVRFIAYDAPFNYSSINNFGATHARGEHLLLLNNDTEVIATEWLRALLEHSQRPEVGVVGAKLLYSDTRIQHAGVIVGIGGVAGHAHLHQPCDHPGYFSRAQLLQNMSAVTFACAMTRREVFAQLGGLNERELTIAFNDVDYCLRAREAGYLVVYTPYATLFHHESKTRGYEDNPEKQARFFQEITYMQSRHKAILQSGDPYYNTNLRLDTHDFAPLPGYVSALPR